MRLPAGLLAAVLAATLTACGAATAQAPVPAGKGAVDRIVIEKAAHLRVFALAIGGGMTALGVLGAVADTLDRRRRLVLDHDGIRWRSGFLGLARGDAAWSELRAATYKTVRRRPDRLRLEFTDRRPVSIPVDGLTVAGEDLPRLIRAVAPHVEISLQ